MSELTFSISFLRIQKSMLPFQTSWTNKDGVVNSWTSFACKRPYYKKLQGNALTGIMLFHASGKIC